jgi:unsaturated rhamnogalacturonyl hydrolase
MMALAGISGDAKYRDAMLAKGETNGWQLPAKGRKYHADDQCIGQTWAELYFLYRENRMIAPMREHFDWILANPSPPSRAWKIRSRRAKARKTGSWCDALFMAPPAWVRLYAATGDERYLNFAVTNWWRTTDYLYDKDEHLFFRDSTFSKRPRPTARKFSGAAATAGSGRPRPHAAIPADESSRPSALRAIVQGHGGENPDAASSRTDSGARACSTRTVIRSRKPAAPAFHLRAGVGRESRPARPREI